MLGPSCQSQASLKRRPDAGATRPWQLCGHCHQLTPELPTGRHVRSTHDACSRRPMRHLVALSVHRRNRLYSFHDSHWHLPTADLLHCCEPSTVSSLAPPSPATHRRSVGIGRWAARRWGTGELPCFGRAGRAIFIGWAKCHPGHSPLQQCSFLFILLIIQNSIQI
jgi:hypothetical protein